MIVLPPEMAHHLGANPFDALMNMQGEVFRKQPLRETSRVYIQDKPYFLKKHFGVTLTECLKNLFAGRLPVIGAEPEWKAIQALTALNIHTTPLVSYGKRGIWPLTQQSYILTQALDDTMSLEDYGKNHLPLTEKRAVIREIARITRLLHTNGWVHRDLYLCHFLRDQQSKLHLIDLHRMFRPRFLKQRWIMKDLAGLLFSSLDLGLTRADVYAFLKVYQPLPLKVMQKIMQKANALYLKSHQQLPQQMWMNTEKSLLPLRVGNFHRTFILEHGRFESEYALRVLDQRRWVIKGIWGGKQAVMKMFARESDYQHELSCAAALRQHAIFSPALYEHGKFQDLYLIIYDYINAHPVNAITPALMRTMATLHENGLMQKDCHRDNFLQCGDQITLLDAGGMVSHEKLSRQTALDNLALLFAQWPPSEDAHHLAQLKYYYQARSWEDEAATVPRFEALLMKVRLQARKKWLKKIFRDCSAIRIKQNLTVRYGICRDFDSLSTASLLAYPEGYFHAHANYLKQGNSSTVVRVTIGNKDVVIKRYNRKNIWVRLKRYVTASKAARAWETAYAMISVGLDTPRPLAFIEKRFGPFRLDSYYVCEYSSGMRIDHLETLAPCERAIHRMMDTLNKVFCQHGDLKASNILWDGEKLYLLDTDAAKFYKNVTLFKTAHEKDWARLLRNWEK